MKQEPQSSAEQLKDMVRQALRMLDDTDTFLWIRVTTGLPVVENKLLGGGNFTSIAAQFAVLNQLAKTRYMLTHGMAASGDLNETKCFCSLVKNLPDDLYLGINQRQAETI